MGVEKQSQRQLLVSGQNSHKGQVISDFTVIPLTAAQLIAMGTTPVSILPAPGASKVIVPTMIGMSIKRTSTAFTTGGVLNFQYHTTTSIVPHVGTIAAAFVTGAAGSAFTLLGPSDSATGLLLPANEGIDITNATAAFAAGTGTAKVFIWYNILTLD